MHLYDGKRLAAERRTQLANAIRTSGLQPGLVSILVGDNEASKLYLKLKERACDEVGIRFERFDFPADVKETEVIGVITDLNGRNDVHGILIQLPLPEGLDEERVIPAMDPKKDADGFHPANLDALERGTPIVIPVMIRVVDALLASSRTKIDGMTMVVLGNSDVFLRPFLPFFGERGATVHTAHDADSALTRTADVLVTALGQPDAITADHIKDGAIVIDVGATPTPDGVKGDVDAASVAQRAAWLSPVPGGVGPLTVAMLLENVARAAGVTL